MLLVMNKEILLAKIKQHRIFTNLEGGLCEMKTKSEKIYLWSLLMNSMRCYQIDPLLRE